MSDEKATSTASAVADTAAETTTASASESTGATGNENQAGEATGTEGSGEGQDAARTGAQLVNGGTGAPASHNPPLSSDQIALAMQKKAAAVGEDVIYVAATEDEGHGGIVPGEQLAAIVVRGGSLPNLKVFCSSSDATLFKASVPFGSLRGQWHF